MSRLITALLLFPLTALSQSGGPYAITQSVIANGGGGPSTGGSFGVTGTVGQAVAGTNSSTAAYNMRSGFWQGEIPPSAATVAVSGRVTTAAGEGLRNAFVTMTKSSGESITARSSSFGYYSFAEVEIGHTYVLTVNSKRYTFTPRLISVTEELSGLHLVALP
jgi:hypothetical protein